MKRRQSKVLRATDAERPPRLPRPEIDLAGPRTATFRLQPAAPEGERRRQQGVHRAGPRASAAARPAQRQVSDLDPYRFRSGLGQRQRQRRREVTGYPVETEGGEQSGTVSPRRRAVLFECPTDEIRFAGRVEIMRPGVHRRLDRRNTPTQKRADRRDEHIAAFHQRPNGLRPRDVGDLGRQTTQFPGETFKTLTRPGGQHGPMPPTHKCSGHQLTGVAGRAEDDCPPGHQPDRPVSGEPTQIHGCAGQIHWDT
ncbi:hypothetical protein MXD59_05140 [Frankia sp. Ag45/Mut15]|uniref:Uncharacterized protein n=1 Tax=Frankia umida TaxID=573489 RepID=A0ABT0JUE6_9ACTN|nr:hypothetical protein [Frankia umida]MCK9875171.1 hypothetical protein [Frankia umida]